jgi:hypothetical protein
MNKPLNHIIKTCSVEVTFKQRQQDTHLQDRIAEVVKHKLLPAIETLFDEKAASGRILRIDTLEIEPETIATQNWEEAFVDATLKKIRQKLDAISVLNSADEAYEISYQLNDTIIDKKPALQNELSALLYFIHYGILPWNVTTSQTTVWFDSLAKNLQIIALQNDIEQKVLNAIFYSADTFRRCITQLPKTLLKALVEAVAQQGKKPDPKRFVLPQHWTEKDKNIVKYVMTFNELGNVRIEDVKTIFSQSLPANQISELAQSLLEQKIENNFGNLVKEIVRDEIFLLKQEKKFNVRKSPLEKATE